MHTRKSKAGTTFHYNSDLSGEVFIVDTLGERINIPFHDILEFVGGIIQEIKVSQIERMGAFEFLGIKKWTRFLD